MAIPLDRFLSLIIGNTTSIKAQLGKVISDSLKQSRKLFEAEEKKVSANTATTNYYLGYPTLEREIHTLFSRFETTSEYQFEQQINEFMTNRKNRVNSIHRFVHSHKKYFFLSVIYLRINLVERLEPA